MSDEEEVEDVYDDSTDSEDEIAEKLVYKHAQLHDSTDLVEQLKQLYGKARFWLFRFIILTTIHSKN